MISLCMIVKNERDNLPRCLASVCEHVDEIIIVDTGSTDDTKVIAQEFNAKIFDFAWVGSFAEARNASLEQASGDWVLILDADEYLTQDQAQQLRWLEKQGEALYQFKILNLCADDNLIEHCAVRFFPNHTDLWFRGRIHEQLDQSPLKNPFPLLTTELTILHEGYTETAILKYGKRGRNRALLLASVQEEPERAFHWFNLGVFYSVEKNCAEALEAFEKAIELESREQVKHTFIQSCYTYGITIALELGDNPKAVSLAEQGLELCSRNPDFWLAFGHVLNAVGRYAEAIHHFKKALNLKLSTGLVTDKGANTWKPFVGIATALEGLGRADAAQRYKEQAHFIRTSL